MTDHRAEEERIRAVYAGRQDRNEDRRYDPQSAEVQLRQQAWQQSVRSALHAWSPQWSSARLLDLGCGHGDWLEIFHSWGFRPQHLVGVELLTERATAARTTLPEHTAILRASGYRLPFADRALDVVVTSTVLSSILDDSARRHLAAELVRIVSSDGCVIIYDFRYNNPNNPDVRAVTLDHVRTLFPHCQVACRTNTLAPPLARRLAPRSRWLAQALARWVPPLRSHATYVITGTAASQAG